MNSSEENSQLTQKAVFEDLKRRLKTTRKARINASKRLRKKHELYEKTTHVYSVLILVLSIWFIGDTGSDDYNLFVTKILLILSLALTFFTMYINTKNYKERASEFETNYQNLDILLNKMDRIESESLKLITRHLRNYIESTRNYC